MRFGVSDSARLPTPPCLGVDSGPVGIGGDHESVVKDSCVVPSNQCRALGSAVGVSVFFSEGTGVACPVWKCRKEASPTATPARMATVRPRYGESPIRAIAVREVKTQIPPTVQHPTAESWGLAWAGILLLALTVAGQGDIAGSPELPDRI